MLVVKVELHSARTGEQTLLGQAIINNVGTNDDGGRADYRVRVAAKRDVGDLRKIARHPLRHGRVEDYPRLSYSVWRLVIRALRSAFPEEDK